ncbi:MAG: glycosyltransferase [Gammaproteobacteria bacterium]|nr:glycosyltransferase [Gammaproteobacteria bacterium]
MPQTISLVIPLATDEDQWLSLCQNFDLLPAGTQIIIVTINSQDISEPFAALQQQFPQLSWLNPASLAGRARQLNAGAQRASNQFIWFLHADSLLNQHNISQLLKRLAEPTSLESLFYFDLFFHDKAQRRLIINEWGAKLRSNWLGLPFGDQGLCLSTTAFERLGGYDEQAAFGEDHLLVWQAKHHDLKLVRCHSALATSARKYQLRGWRNLTLKYQILWPQQAWPQLVKLLKIKLKL